MKQREIKIAVTGVGAQLGQSITRAALYSKQNYRIFTLDVDDDAKYIFPSLPFYKTVHINFAGYCNYLEKFLIKNKIDLLFFGSEREMLGVLGFRNSIEKKTGVKLALSDDSALQIGMDKFLTAELLRKFGLPYPKTIKMNDKWDKICLFADKIGYPCIVKGRRTGQPFIIRTQDDLAYFYRNYPDGVVQEFLGNERDNEYTVGLFYTPEYGITHIYCMSRYLRYGLTWRGQYERNQEVENIARSAVEILKPTGSVNVQIRYHKGKPVVHEFNVRCSSTTVFRALSGWNEIDMAVDYFLYGKKPKIINKIKPGKAIRFFQEAWAQCKKYNEKVKY